ncbi:MAG: riboflavin biosynthesis protein RibF [Candidatus Omnitrophica bacterium]|nr:riboflavin biosynthesis protein RibF [Candidatus Omnitrophota bacterium]
MITLSKFDQAKKFKDPVIALGVFDGVHKGHRMILSQAVRKARQIKGKSIVVTFWPHPQKKQSLYSLKHRLRLIDELGVDACLVIDFTKKFSRMKAEDFVNKVLVRKIKARYIYVGKNFRFGHRARGDYRFLKKMSAAGGFYLKAFEVLKKKGDAISSTLIRRLISGGKLKQAEALLGRPVSILGTVGKGSSFGRKLGFPTANIDPHHEVVPAAGVYAVRVFLGQKKMKGACYIGVKPTFIKQKINAPHHRQARRKNISIEAYIFNFNKNIYGRELELQFLRKIRNERKFTSPVHLARQIRKDVTVIKDLFSRHN